MHVHPRSHKVTLITYYKIFNKRIKIVEESLHVKFDEVFAPDCNDDCDDLPLHDLSLNENANVGDDQVVQSEVEDTLSLQK